MLSLATKIKQRLRWQAIDLKHKLGLNSNFDTTQPGVRILIYHGLDISGQTDINSRFISVAEFEKHLNWLKNCCEVVSLEDYFKGVRHPDKLTVAITFDDGYKNNFTLALPLLEKYQLPATFFVTTSSLEGLNMLWPDLLDMAGFFLNAELVYKDEKFKYSRHKGYISITNGSDLKSHLMDADLISIRTFIKDHHFLLKEIQTDECKLYWELMNEDELKAASKSPFITLGSHSVVHSSMTKISSAEAREELVNSRATLIEIIGLPVTSFAFPFGDYTPELVEMAVSAGYEQVACVDYRFDSHSNLHERFGINPHISFPVQVAEIKRGSYL